jgi:hypothetical protein
MLLVRDVMYCRPGQARPMVQKFLTVARLSEQLGLPRMRVMTDISAERYWTVVSEMEVESLQQYEDMSRRTMGMKEFQEIMKGYHEHVDHGRREIYTLES